MTASEAGRNCSRIALTATKFLERGLGLKPDMADALSRPLDQNNDSSVSTALQRYGHQYHLTPAQVLQTTTFINEAANMPTQDNGQYAVSLPPDNHNRVGTHVI